MRQGRQVRANPDSNPQVRPYPYPYPYPLPLTSGEIDYKEFVDVLSRDKTVGNDPTPALPLPLALALGLALALALHSTP